MSSKKHILVVDDEEGMRISLKNLLELEGYEVSTADSAKKALSVMQDEAVHLVISDIVMPDMSGLSFLSNLNDNLPVIMITAYASIETARKAFKLGARDYLVKPFEFSELSIVIKQYLHSEIEGEALLSSQNLKVQKLLRLADKTSSTDIPILILGESGTGKEVLANHIYEHGPRAGLPFIKVNCAAIPDTLLESELFGYEKGAFTGAQTLKIGLLEKANHGTVFLDEIGDMPLPLQAKLLRVLQNFSFTRLGGTKDVTVDCRIIAASNHDLHRQVAEKSFREDLYYRVNNVELQIPPLRERMEDLHALIDFFLKKFNEKYGKAITQIDERAHLVLSSYAWPGNVRELKNCIERAVVVCDEQVIQSTDLPDSILNSEEKVDIREPSLSYRAEYMREIIFAALKKTNGNKSEAAKELRITRRTLYNWIQELDLHT
ncbi:MAG: sigma-54 dependent transcriptional regulator [Spirochaetia bacterium]